MSTAHVVLANSYRPPSRGARRVRDLDPYARIEVTVTIRGPELPQPAAGAKPLTPEEFASHYGAMHDAQRVASVLRGCGLSVDSITQAGRSLHVSGPVVAMQAAFKANLGVYHDPARGEFRGREGSLEIPASLDGVIVSVLGLDQRRVAYRKAAVAGAPSGLSPQTPADIEKLYGFPAGTASGQIIAIAEFGQPMSDGTFQPPMYLPDDVSAFCRGHGRALPNVQVVSINLSPVTLDQLKKLPPEQQNIAAEEAGEVMMDVEIIAALCPDSTVQVMFASFDQKGWVDLLDATTSAASGVPVALSVSWGASEDSPDWSAAALTAINERLQIAALHGITVCVASGDDGTSDGMSDKAAHVDFPASSPFVLGVGGTQLVGSAGAVQEVAWWESPGRRTRKGGGATGGGVSTKFARPAWQDVRVASVNPASIDGRVVPDVAALAGQPLYDLMFAGHDSPNGGTSAAAPVWASLIARVNAALPAGKGQRFLTPLLYTTLPGDPGPVGTTACRGITTGNNASNPNPGKGYSAGPGYNAVAGWGVPSGLQLLEQLKR